MQAAPTADENTQPFWTGENSQQQWPEAAAAGKALVRRLTYCGGPGEEGYARKLKVISQCFQYKSALFGTGKRSEFYKLIAEDCNRYFPELFNNMLKENSVRDLWNKAVKDSAAQQVDKEKRHHLWYNGSILREMTDYESLLDEIFTEKKAVESKKQAEAEKDAADEKDKRERLNAAFSRTEERYAAGGQTEGAIDDKSPSPEKVEAKEGTPLSDTGAAYGRGTSKGNQHRAGLNSGLTPDAKHDKLAEACRQQSDIAHTVQDILKEMTAEKRKSPEPPTELEREQVRISKMAATAQLMETYLKFQQSGVEMPAIFKELLRDFE